MSIQTYRQIITQGIEGLPEEMLVEIADFIYFVRRRKAHPQDFAEELKQLSRAQNIHLEQEFAGYDQRYPRE
jgi:hypothetical protein